MDTMDLACIGELSEAEINRITNLYLGVELRVEILRCGINPETLSRPPVLGIGLLRWALLNSLPKPILELAGVIERTDEEFLSMDARICHSTEIINTVISAPN